jgi:hypothetical protein
MYRPYYTTKLQGRLYTKNGKNFPKFGVGGLHYRSQTSLSKLDSLEVGETIMINNDKITRVQ